MTINTAPLPATAYVSAPGASRVDLLLIAQMVEANTRVLDVGCGEGELLHLLAETKNVDARGIWTQHGSQPLAHGGGRRSGERHRQDARGRHLALADQVGDTTGHRGRLA